ncbi:MAG: Ig-like domain-containing protein, partial [Thermoanaerobaculia bacterium]
LEDWEAFGIYTPAGYDIDENGEIRVNSCRNPGSRDQNVLTAKISLGLRVTAPTNYKPFDADAGVIEFPMTVWNNTGQDRQFELTIVYDDASLEPPSFAKDDLGDYDFPVLSGAVTILPYSSSSLNVYAFDDLPFRVKVEEVESCTEFSCVPVEGGLGLTGSMTLNAPAYAPPGGTTLDYRYQSSQVAVNPVPRNPVPRNPVPRNPVPRNPVPRNSTVEDVIDYSWTVTTASADDTGTYLTIPNIDKAFQDDYIFQVFITKPSVLRQVSGECDPSNLPLGTLIGHISDPANPVPRNPVPRNPVPRNPVPRNATLSDTLIQNTTFTLSSDTTAAEGGQPLSLGNLAPEGCDPMTGGGRFGECTLFAPREPGQLTITIRSYQIDEDPDPVWNPHGDLDAPQTLPSVIVTDYWCTGPDSPDGCAFAQDGPELVPDVVTAGVAPETVRVGQTVTFPLSDFGYTNVGTQAAQEHRIGYYISTADSVSALPRNTDGTIDTSSPETELLFSVAALALQPEDPATVSSAELTVPLDIPRPDEGTGTYYVWVYVDDQRVVSELNEDDNFIRGGPITVIPENVPPSNIQFGTVVDAREGEPVTLTVTFDDPGDSGEGYIYLWDFGDGNTCDSSEPPNECGATATHTYAQSGPYTITVTIIDSGGLEGTGSLDVVVSNVAPTAKDDAYGTDEDTTLAVVAPGVLDNDTDPADELTGAVLVSGPSEGDLTLNNNGSFTYTPNVDFNGSDSFTYKTSDGADESNVATVTITVNPVNDAPVAVEDAYATSEDVPLVAAAPGVLGNDTDVD